MLTKFNKIVIEEKETFISLLETIIKTNARIFDSRTVENQIYYMVTLELWVDVLAELRRKSSSIVKYLDIDVDNVLETYNKCKELIKLLNNSKIIVENLENDTLIREQLPILTNLYLTFTKSLEEIQIKCLERFSFKSRQTPRLYIPFCYALNKLASECLVLEDDTDALNGDLYIQQGYIKDNVYRYKKKFEKIGVVAYTYKKVLHSIKVQSNGTLKEMQAPYLPERWCYMKGRENEVQYTQRLSDVAFAYSNYCFIGYNTIIASDNKKIFFLNYPLVGIFNKSAINTVSLVGERKLMSIY